MNNQQLDNIINTLMKNDNRYSISYWTIGDKNTLKKYINDDTYFYGMAYKDKDVQIYKFAINGSDLEEWLTIGLTEKDVDYIRNSIQ